MSLSIKDENEESEESENQKEKKNENQKEKKEEEESIKSKIKIPKLKLEPLEPVTPIKIRRFSQPLIKHSFNNESKNVEIQIIKNSNTNKNSRLNTLTSNRPVSSYKKHLNKDYLDTIMCESKILMSIINEAKIKVYDKPISIFEKAKNNYKNHQRLKSAREHLKLNSNQLNHKRVRFGSITYSGNEFNNYFNNVNLTSSSKNKRNSIIFFDPSSLKTDSHRKISLSTPINNLHSRTNTNNSNFSNRENLHIIHENHNEKHEEQSDKNSDSEIEKKISVDVFKTENMTQTNFYKINTKKKIDKLSIKFSKIHNDKLFSFCGLKNYDNIIYRNKIKKEIKAKSEKESNSNLRYKPKTKKYKHFRIDIEDSEEVKKKTKKFLKNIVQIRTFLSCCNSPPHSLRQDY